MTEITSTESVNKTTLAEQIWNSLENSKDGRSVGWERKQKQKEILKRLPADLEKQIKRFALSIEPSEFNRRVAGEIFEHIVRADTNICPEVETREAQIVRSIMKEPFAYHLEKYGIVGSVRQPDFAHMNQKKQFDRAVEVKATQIGPRAIDQLKKFKGNLIRVVDIIEDLKEKDKQILEEHGLGEIANSSQKLEVAENFAITVAVPHGTYEGVSGLLIDEASFGHDNDAIEEAVETLDSCTIIESPFSRDDLGIITQSVVSWLHKESPQEIDKN